MWTGATTADLAEAQVALLADGRRVTLSHIFPESKSGYSSSSSWLHGCGNVVALRADAASCRARSSQLLEGALKVLVRITVQL